MKRLNKTINKCFKKVRVTEKVDKEKEELFKKWKNMKNNLNDKNRSEFDELENKLVDKYGEEHMEKIKARVGNIDCNEGGINNAEIWKLKKDLFPRSKDPPTAIIDPQSGNLLTNVESIENAAINVYEERLKNKPMDDDLEHIKEAKESLCEKLLKIAEANKTPPWCMKDLDKVLQSLKKQKSRDPYMV